MPVEPAVYVNDLVDTYPAGNEPATQGDNHLRMLKEVLQNTFPGASKAFRFPVVLSKAISYVVLAADDNATILGDASAAAIDQTLPTLGAGEAGWSLTVTKVDSSANAVRLVGTINGTANLSLTKQYQTAYVTWSGTAWVGVIFSRVISGGVAVEGGTLDITGAATIAGFLTLSSTRGLKGPAGTTAQRDGTPSVGERRFNSTLNTEEFWDGTTWRPISTSPPASSVTALAVNNNSGSPNTQIDVSAAEAVLVDTNANAVKHLAVAVTVDSTVTGANGCDVGTRAANTEYFLWLISNGTTIAGLFSTSATAPTMPGGYTYKKRVSWQRTDASSNFRRIRQRGRDAQYVVVAGSPTPSIPQMAGGNVGSGVIPDVVVGVATFIPPTAVAIVVMLTQTNAQAVVAPNGSYGSLGGSNPPPVGMSTTSQLYLQATMLLESTTIYWSSNTGNGALRCCGWEDNV